MHYVQPPVQWPVPGQVRVIHDTESSVMSLYDWTLRPWTEAKE